MLWVLLALCATLPQAAVVRADGGATGATQGGSPRDEVRSIEVEGVTLTGPFSLP